MTADPLSEKLIATLVGGQPLDHAFYPDSEVLVVIAPSGQKLRFPKEKWQSALETSKTASSPSSGTPKSPAPLGEKPGQTAQTTNVARGRPRTQPAKNKPRTSK